MRTNRSALKRSVTVAVVTVCDVRCLQIGRVFWMWVFYTNTLRAVCNLEDRDKGRVDRGECKKVCVDTACDRQCG